jgi:hypothetical protein
MGERYHWLNEIGFDWDPTGVRAAKEVSWDEGFEELVSFFWLKVVEYNSVC